MRVETARLRIRDLEAGDRPVVQAWRSDPDVMRYLDSRPPSGAADDWLDRALERNAAKPRLYHDCAIEEKPTATSGTADGRDSGERDGGERDGDERDGDERDRGDVVGWISLGHAPNFLTTDWVVGYLLRREYWGRGYATEALVAVLDYGFDVLRVPRIYAECYLANTASARVMERAGMRRVGRVPSIDPSLGESVRYLLSRDERPRRGGRRG